MNYEIHIDKWEGNVDNGSSFILNNDSVEPYLNLLDGKLRTQILIIRLDRKNSLLIGGGNGTYVVTFTVGNDEDFYNLIDGTKNGDREIELVTGGQAGFFLDKYCLDFNTVVAAADYYILHGKRNPTLDWEKQ